MSAPSPASGGGLPVPTSATMLLSRETSSNEDGVSVGKGGGLMVGGKVVEITEEVLVIREPQEKVNANRSVCIPCWDAISGGKSNTDKTEAGVKRIKFYDILWAEIKDEVLTVDYCITNKTKATLAKVQVGVDQESRSQCEDLVQQILAKAYGESPLRKRLLILLNPFGGTGAAIRIFNTHCLPILRASQSVLTIQSTTHRGHATEIARDLDLTQFDGILCCSGDGLPHEVYNGLAARPDARKALATMAVGQLPGGSGNAMCHNLTGTGSPSLATLSIIKSVKQPIDLVSITQGEKRILSFLSQSLGIVAEADLATEHLRWMGDSRFVWGIMQRIIKNTVWPCDLAVKLGVEGGVEEVREHYRKVHTATKSGYKDEELAAQAEAEDQLEGEGEGLPRLKFGTVNDPLPSDWEFIEHPNMGNFYAGNMAWVSADVLMFPASLPHEGVFDLITMDGTLPRMEALKILSASGTGKHWDMDHVLYRKVLGYRIVPRQPEGYVSIDGERIPFEKWQAEVHRGLGRVWGKGKGRGWANSGV